MSDQTDLVKMQPKMPAHITHAQPVQPDLPAVEMNTGATIRQGFIVLVLGFGGFLVWAATAPLDEGVPIEGQVSLETKNKVIQHYSGGIVDTLLVKEGQFVKKGDVLLTLDAANTKARYEEIRHHYLGLRSSENRLNSEQAGQPSIDFHPDLMQAAQDQDVQAKMADQQQLLRARQRLLFADIVQIQESIHADQAAIKGSVQLIENRQAELKLVKQQLADMREAVEEGYVARTQYTELQQRAAQLAGDIAQINANISQSRNLILEHQSKINSRRQAENKDVQEQLARVRLEVDADQQKFNALKNELERTELRAPVDGQVIGLQLFSAGMVIQPGQKLMNIVPLTGKLLFDARIPPDLVDRIATGQAADIRFNAFAHTPQLIVEGKVISVSTDVIADPAARVDAMRQYFLARVEVTDDGMKILGNRLLKPGMPAQIVVKTGERTFLTYLLHPLTKRLAASLKEE